MQKIAHQDRFAVLLVYNMNAHNFISCDESNSVIANNLWGPLGAGTGCNFPSSTYDI